jgi:hypothetical protein
MLSEHHVRPLFCRPRKGNSNAGWSRPRGSRRPTPVACHIKLIALQRTVAIVGVGLPQLTRRRLLLGCYHS